MRAPFLSYRSQNSPLRCALIVGARRSEAIFHRYPHFPTPGPSSSNTCAAPKTFTTRRCNGGVLAPDDGSEDVFVRHTGIAGSGFKFLEEGEKVIYEVTQGRKGLQAANVSKSLFGK